MKKVWLVLIVAINACNISAAEADRPERSREEAIETAKLVGKCVGVVVLCIGARRYLPVTKKYLDTKVDDLKTFMTKDVRNYLADKIDGVSKKLTDLSGEFRGELRGAEGRLSKQIKDSSCETNSKIDQLGGNLIEFRKAVEERAQQQAARHANLDQKVKRILDILEKAHQQ